MIKGKNKRILAVIMENLYQYKGKVLSVYDGDGVYRIAIDLGMGLTVVKHCRLSSVDCPELRGNQHRAGIIVRDYVREVILGKDVILKTYKDRSGKYGRLLVDVSVGGMDLGEHLRSKGFARPYDGLKREPWGQNDLRNIIASSL